MSPEIPDTAETLTELYSACHENFRRLMTEAREMIMDEDQFASECQKLCDQMVELQRTWNAINQSRRSSEAA